MPPTPYIEMSVKLLRKHIVSIWGVISGMNGVAMARHGPILNDNEATGYRRFLHASRASRIPCKIQKWPP